MTATDELRKLLDERGIEWDYGILGAHSTEFNVNGVWASFVAIRDGVTCSTIFTPEQVIQATLRETCRIVTDGRGHWECDACGCDFGGYDSCDPSDPPACNYCPNCGAKVVSE